MWKISFLLIVIIHNQLCEKFSKLKTILTAGKSISINSYSHTATLTVDPLILEDKGGGVSLTL